MKREAGIVDDEIQPPRKSARTEVFSIVECAVEDGVCVADMLNSGLFDEETSGEREKGTSITGKGLVTEGYEVFGSIFVALERMSMVVEEINDIHNKLRRLGRLHSETPQDPTSTEKAVSSLSSTSNCSSSASDVGKINIGDERSDCIDYLPSTFLFGSPSRCNVDEYSVVSLSDGKDKADSEEVLCARYRELQSRVIPALVLQLRQLNRGMCNAVKHCGELVDKDSTTLAVEMQQLTNALFELAWFRRRMTEEEAFEPTTWLRVRSEGISDDEYTHLFCSEPFFVSVDQDRHQFTLNLLQYEMEARTRGNEELDKIKRNRQSSEQRLVALKKKEGGIQQVLGKLEDAVKSIHKVCEMDSSTVVAEFPVEARNLPGPLLNIFSRFFSHRHIMNDTDIDVSVSKDFIPENEDVKEHAKFSDSYYSFPSVVVVVIRSSDEQPPVQSNGDTSFSAFPIRIIFQYHPLLDVVTAVCKLSEKLGPQANVYFLANILDGT
eukprot:GHVQ01009103.1.p1 GENE.GHVQ01009103.1~~GHVQ01009103.1.p1  ORF type:complete len:494 (-),score=63.60 GHVQ01009103.1:72-1553(-)